MLTDFRPYTTNPSPDALREIAVDYLLAQAAYRTAWREAEANPVRVPYRTKPLGPELSAGVKAAGARIAAAQLAWEKATGTVWWTRGWREIVSAANEG